MRTKFEIERAQYIRARMENLFGVKPSLKWVYDQIEAHLDAALKYAPKRSIAMRDALVHVIAQNKRQSDKQKVHDDAERGEGPS